MYKKILINYSDIYYSQSQKKNSETGISVGGFDKVIEYQKKDIDVDFFTKNQNILSQPRGAGYWLWKPYIILKSLSEIDYGDMVFYSDSGSDFVQNISSLIPYLDSDDKQILVFELDGHRNITWIKRDCLILTESDEPNFLNKNMILATFILLRKNNFTIQFIKEWLTLCEDYRNITDSPNELGMPNYSEFIEHRHDQSVLSVLARKHNLNVFPDISQFGENMENFSQIVYHHRNKN